MTILAISEAGYAGVGYAGLGHGGLGHGGFAPAGLGHAGLGHAGFGHGGFGPAGLGQAGPYTSVGRYIAPAPIAAPVAPVASAFAGHGGSVPIPIGGGHDIDYYVSFILIGKIIKSDLLD